MWKWIVGSLLLLSAFFIYRIVTGIRRSLRLGGEQVEKALSELQPEDIPRLTTECREFFRSDLGDQLDLTNWREAAFSLDSALKDRDKRQKLVRGLARDDVSYYWVLVMGAFLGELLTRHAGGQWVFSRNAAPFLEIDAGGGKLTTWPFDKIQKHFWQGDAGDLVAYVNTHLNLDQMVAHLDRLEENPSRD